MPPLAHARASVWALIVHEQAVFHRLKQAALADPNSAGAFPFAAMSKSGFQFLEIIFVQVGATAKRERTPNHKWTRIKTNSSVHRDRTVMGLKTFMRC
jgi:hypothetical protein